MHKFYSKYDRESSRHLFHAASQSSDEQMSMTKKILHEVSLIGTKYRLLSMIDSNADIYEKNGLFIVYHIALESEDHNMNHGIYQKEIV